MPLFLALGLLGSSGLACLFIYMWLRSRGRELAKRRQAGESDRSPELAKRRQTGRSERKKLR